MGLWYYQMNFTLNKIHESLMLISFILRIITKICNQEYQEHLCSVTLKRSTMLCYAAEGHFIRYASAAVSTMLPTYQEPLTIHSYTWKG